MTRRKRTTTEVAVWLAYDGVAVTFDDGGERTHYRISPHRYRQLSNFIYNDPAWTVRPFLAGSVGWVATKDEDVLMLG